MSDKEVAHQIERLIDRLDHLEKHHTADHDRIMRIVEDSNSKLSRAFWLVGSIITVGTLIFEVMNVLA